MTTHEERQRLSAMGNALRPDWPVNSLYSLLTSELVVKRAYRDVAVALAWVAADSATKTPARLCEPGPWWRATPTDGGAQMFDPMCHACWTPHDPSEACDTTPRNRRAREHLYAQARDAIRHAKENA